MRAGFPLRLPKGGEPEQHCSGRDRHLEVIRRPDHGGRGRIAVRELQGPGEAVCEPEDEIRLDEERNRDPDDRQRVGENHLSLLSGPFRQHPPHPSRRGGDRGDHQGFEEKVLFPCCPSTELMQGHSQAVYYFSFCGRYGKVYHQDFPSISSYMIHFLLFSG